jgi:hypothetical protein
MMMVGGGVAMDAEKTRLSISTKSDGTFTLTEGAAVRDLTFEEMFSYGHYCLNTRKYTAALRIFEVLVRLHGTDRQVKVMLARCKACIGRYDTCREILKAAFASEDDVIVERLHEAFLYESVGMEAAAIHELAAVVMDFLDLPTACLFLGDLCASVGEVGRAASYWKAAVKRDKRGGAVAVTAQGELARLEEETESERENDA